MQNTKSPFSSKSLVSFHFNHKWLTVKNSKNHIAVNTYVDKSVFTHTFWKATSIYVFGYFVTYHLCLWLGAPGGIIKFIKIKAHIYMILKI